MFSWIGSKAFAGHDAPDAVRTAMTALGDLTELSALRSPEGGIDRRHVVQRLSGRAAVAGLHADPGSLFDGIDLPHRLALRVEAGRAHTNNDAVMAVLEAARDPRIDMLLLVVPVRYKSGAVVDPVRERLTALLQSAGIDLALTGVALSSY